LEIVTEQTALGDATLWFDHIAITNVDTVMVNDDTPFVTGIQDFTLDADVRLSPNPTSGLLQLSSLEKVSLEVQVLNANGIEVDRFELQEDIARDFSALPTGIYFLSFSEQGAFRGVRRIVKTSGP